MLKITALNESSSSSESEDEDNPRLSSEAQEFQAKTMYEKAQLLTINNDFQEALNTFETILTLPYLTENLNKPLSPLQLQIRLGCLKCLSTLYRSGPTKNLSEALKVLEMITQLEPTNVNFWYRLGKVALEHEDLDVAFDAFQSTLNYSPGHWGSIENLVTISYVLHDFLGCLRFCTMGLNKDSAFVKGLVFRDHIFKCNPWIKRTFEKSKSGFESLFLTTYDKYSDSLKLQYLNEARSLVQRYKEQKLILRKEEQDEEKEVIKSPYTLKSPTFANLITSVIQFHDHIKKLGTLLRPVDFTTVISNNVIPTNGSSDDICTEACAENAVEEGSQPSSILRSRSSSDDKESCPNFNTSEGDEKAFEDDSQTTMPSSSSNAKSTEGSPDDESAQRKKAKRDVKWWQIEGKRRSQRVRGNLIPTPNKSKSESSFTELLRNIIPTSLLIEEVEELKESSKSSKEVAVNGIDNNSYFGTLQETADVKCFITQWGKTDIITIITKLTRLLSKECKGKWPGGLSDKFLELYNLYRDLVPLIASSIYSENSTDVEEDVFAILARAELLIESSDKNNSKMNKESLQILEEFRNTLDSNCEFTLRKKWLKVHDYLQKCNEELIDYSYLNWDLNEMLEILNNKPQNYVCYIPTQKDNVISVANVKEKINYVKKIESLSKIEELRSEKKYEELVEILLFSLASDKDTIDDFNNRLILTDSYFNLRKVECLEQCEKIFEYGLKNSTEYVLSKSVTILVEIWKNMKESMSVKHFKLIINIVIKALMFSEKQNLSDDSFVTECWCLLHSVLCYFERKEPVFYLEEESVPNSILALQFGHDILSKSNKCCVNEGQFLLYTITSLLELQHVDEYWGFEETKNCLDQTILCLYSHPNKKYKLKNLKDHNAPGVKLDWSACCQLYKYYKLEELPEFDSIASRSISAEVENLFQRILQEMPEDMQPLEAFNKMKEYVEGNIDTQPPESLLTSFDTFDIYYLLADFNLKNKNLQKAVEFYIWDLAVCPIRFDTWAAIALAKAEEIFCTINSCDSFKIEEIIPKAEAVIRCFRQALQLDVANPKVRIEFGSFLYSLHSVYSRELKFHTDQLSIDMFEEIEKKKSSYLLEAQCWFEPYVKNHDEGSPETNQHNEEVWINHYMLGKISEKLHPYEPEIFLNQYELAGKLLHEKEAPYPVRINYYNPPEFALEALEIYYRIHASILSFVERITEYSVQKEDLLLSFLSRADQSPFVKSKQRRGTDANEVKRKGKGADDSISKKDAAEISNLLKEMLYNVEELVNNVDSDSDSTITSSQGTTESDTSDDETDVRNFSKPLAPMKSLSLSAFKERMKEKELKDARILEEAKKAKLEEKSSEEMSKILPVNPFSADFNDVQFGKVISQCLQAMKECVLRYPQCFKAYYRLAYAYQSVKKDFRKALMYFMGNQKTDESKIVGLYGERKPNNLFHGVWRHPIDDIDRPGSFPFHMAKSIQLLLIVSRELNDHQLLAEIGIQLAKVPDSHNAYLFTEDREQFSKEAIRSCSVAAKKSIPKDRSKLVPCGQLIYDTYIKFQKHYPKDNVVAPVLLEVYKEYALSQSYVVVDQKQISLSDAVKFFQHCAWMSKTTGNAQSRILANHPKPADSQLSLLTNKKPLDSQLSLFGNPKPMDSQLSLLTNKKPLDSQLSLFANMKPSDPQPSLFANKTPLDSQLSLFANVKSSESLLSSVPNKKPPDAKPSLIANMKSSDSFLSLVPNNKSTDPQLSLMSSKMSTDSQLSLVSTSKPYDPQLSLTSIKKSTDPQISVVPNKKPLSDSQLSLTSIKKSTDPQNSFVSSLVSKKKPSDSQLSLTSITKSVPQNSVVSKKKKSSDSQLSLSSKKKLLDSDSTQPQPILVPRKKLETVQLNTQHTGNRIYQNSGNYADKMFKPRPVHVVRKSNGGYGGWNKPSYASVGPRPYMNSSPFQAQATAIVKPPTINYAINSHINSVKAHQPAISPGSPKPAHSQSFFKSPGSSNSFNEERGVVDLTTKSPEKILGLDLWGSPEPYKDAVPNRPLKRPIQNVSFETEKRYPLPPKKKHFMIPSNPSPKSFAEHPDVEIITLE